VNALAYSLTLRWVSTISGPVLLLLLLACAGCKARVIEDTPASSSGNALKVYLWEDSIPEPVFDEFTRQTGIPIQADTFGQLEELIERVRKEPSRYDLITPSDYALKMLDDDGLLRSLPAECTALRDQISERFRHPWYDPELRHCLPYQWSLTGLAYNKTRVTNPPRSWADLFDPGRCQAWAGRVSLLDDAREVLGVAILASGHAGVSTSDAAVLLQAEAKVRGILPYISRLDSEHYEEGLVSGALWIAQGYNGDLARAQHHHPEIEYVIPKEGAILSVDNLAIPSGAQQVAAASRFMAFLLQPAIARRITSAQGLGSTIKDGTTVGGDLPLDEEIVYGLPAPERTYLLKQRGAEAAAEDTIWKAVREL